MSFFWINFSSSTYFSRISFHFVSSPILANGHIFCSCSGKWILPSLLLVVFLIFRLYIVLRSILHVFVYLTSLLSICFHMFPVFTFVGSIPSIAAFVCVCILNFHLWCVAVRALYLLCIAFPSISIPEYIHFWSSTCVCVPPLLRVSCHSLACLVSSVSVCIFCISRCGFSFRVPFRRICTEPSALSCSSLL